MTCLLSNRLPTTSVLQPLTSTTATLTYMKSSYLSEAEKMLAFSSGLENISESSSDVGDLIQKFCSQPLKIKSAPASEGLSISVLTKSFCCVALIVTCALQGKNFIHCCASGVSKEPAAVEMQRFRPEMVESWFTGDTNAMCSQKLTEALGIG